MDNSDSSRGWNIALWIVQVLLALAFLFAGGAKLAGAEQMIAIFEAVGIGQWFRYVTGVLEIGGAILLLIPAFAGLGALVLATVLVGAIFAQLFLIGASPLPPLVLLALALIVARGRRRRTQRLIRQ